MTPFAGSAFAPAPVFAQAATAAEPASAEQAAPRSSEIRTIVSGFFVAPSDSAIADGLAIRTGADIAPVTSIAGSGPFSMSLPASTFLVDDPTLPVSISATLGEDGDLPEWIRFDPATGSFTIDAPEGTTGVFEIVITATLPGGESASATLIITLEAEDIDEASLEAPGMAVTIGKPAFSDIVRAASRVGLATHAGDLDVDTTEMLAESLPDTLVSDDMTKDYKESLESA